MSVLFAYPGQGAQRPGMLAALPDEPPVRACLEQAADCLGQAPAELESAEALRGTRAVQLCLLIAGVAASRLLETRGHRPGLVAGLSIGAYPAAVVAGALDFDDALRLVALRGELMQAAWPEGYGMSAILGLEQAQLEALILAVRARRVEWLATLRSAYERGARLHLELPPGRILSGLARPLFGCATPAFEGSRADTLDALLREEEKRTR